MADDDYIQGLVDATESGGTLVLPWKSSSPYAYQLDGLQDDGMGGLDPKMIVIDKAITIDFNGNTIQFKYNSSAPNNDPVQGRNKGFNIVAATALERVIFRNGVFESGDTDPTKYYRSQFGPVITSTSNSTLSIGLFQIDSCVFRNLSYGCNFNCAGGGVIENAVLSNCLFENMVQKPGDPEEPGTYNDAERGKGAAFSFGNSSSGLSESSGVSYGNVFRDCARHCLYVSQGGPFLSMGDKFYNQATYYDGEFVHVPAPYQVAAMQFGREGHFKIIGGYFEECLYGICISPQSANTTTADVIPDISISDCTFVNPKVNGTTQGIDIILNAGAPEFVPTPPGTYKNGIFSNVVVENTKHFQNNRLTSAIAIQGFLNMTLRDIDIEVKQPDTGDNLILIYVAAPYVNATTDPVKNNNLTIDRIAARYEPLPTKAQVVYVKTDVYGNFHNPIVKIGSIDTNGTPVYLEDSGGGTIANPNFKWFWS